MSDFSQQEALAKLSARLADVEPPPLVDWSGFYLALVLIVATAVIGLWIWQRRRSQKQTATNPRQAALQQLQHIQQQWQHGHWDDRQTAYHLATLLRLGLGLPQLTEQPPSQLDDPQQWQPTIQTLSQLRYRPGDTQLLQSQIFTTIEQWLRCAERQPC